MELSSVTTRAFSPGAWLRGRSQPLARAALICFPHAGGSAGAFLRWFRAAPKWLQIISVQYPGREDRSHEPPYTELSRVAEAILPELQRITIPLALFGHSYGARIGYEVARKLGRSAPCAGLFVSASEAPWVTKGTQYHLLPDDELWTEICRLGGTARAVQLDPEIRDAALPALRADYQASETYRWLPGPRLTQPVVAMVGTDDRDVSHEDVMAWRDATEGPFARHAYAGGHFYIDHERAAVLHTVVEQLKHIGVARPPPPEHWPSTP